MIDLIIDIGSSVDYINKFNRDKLSDDLYKYILEESKGINLNSEICIKVHSAFEFNEVEKRNFINMLRSTSEADIQEIILMQKYLNKKCLALAVLGIIGIIIAYYLNESSIMSELFLIIGWVGVWEALYIKLFDEVTQKIKTKRIKQIARAKVEFYGN